MKEVLIDLFEQFGQQERVAQELGVSQPTISLWIKLCGLEQRKVLVEKGERLN